MFKYIWQQLELPNSANALTKSALGLSCKAVSIYLKTKYKWLMEIFSSAYTIATHYRWYKMLRSVYKSLQTSTDCKIWRNNTVSMTKQESTDSLSYKAVLIILWLSTNGKSCLAVPMFLAKSVHGLSCKEVPII